MDLPLPAQLLPDIDKVIGKPDKNIHCLSNDTLCDILDRLDFADRLEFVPLVCKSWSRLAQGPVSLWQHVEIHAHQEDALQQILSWLTLRGAAVRQLEASFMRWLPSKHAPAPPFPRHHQGFAAFTALLFNLQRLTLTAPTSCIVAEQNLSILQSLTNLETLRLSVASNGSWQYDTLECLQNLVTLKHLHLHVRDMGQKPLLLPSSMSMLSQLTSLHVARAFPIQTLVPYSTANFAAAVSKLTQLKRLTLDNVVDSFPEQLSQLQLLQSLSLQGSFKNSWSSISLCGTKSTAEPMRCRFMPCWSLQPIGWLGNCTAISRLPALTKISLTAVNLMNIPADQWVFSTHLTCLTISSCGLKSLPKNLLGLTSLQQLSINFNPVIALPDGPYLEHLTQLEACGLSLTETPQALSQATSLRILRSYTTDKHLNNNKVRAFLPLDCRMVYWLPPLPAK